MKYLKDFKKLCTPASVYLFINVIIFIVIAIQNFGNTTKYCVGQYKCKVPNTFSMFLFKAVYILFWTFILNAICKAGYKEVSWFMVLLPIILLFIIIGIIILNSGPISIFEGMIGQTSKDQKKLETDEAAEEQKQKTLDLLKGEEAKDKVAYGAALVKEHAAKEAVEHAKNAKHIASIVESKMEKEVEEGKDKIKLDKHTLVTDAIKGAQAVMEARKELG